MDHNFTRLLKKWLETSPEKRDYTVGALYVLKLSGNHILYTNLITNIGSRHADIEYQIQKYYNFRVADLTHEEVEELQKEVDIIMEKNAEAIEQAVNAGTSEDPADGEKPQPVGKRADHDSLPDEIKSCYVENFSILQQMRELHLKLRSLSLENVTCPDSERYPFLKELIRLDKKLHENWDKYDHYIPE